MEKRHTYTCCDNTAIPTLLLLAFRLFCKILRTAKTLAKVTRGVNFFCHTLYMYDARVNIKNICLSHCRLCTNRKPCVMGRTHDAFSTLGRWQWLSIRLHRSLAAKITLIFYLEMHSGINTQLQDRCRSQESRTAGNMQQRRGLKILLQSRRCYPDLPQCSGIWTWRPATFPQYFYRQVR